MTVASFGFFRVATASPALKVGDCTFNAEQHLSMMKQAQEQAVDLLIFPELSLTGYTCADLFHQDTLRQAAIDALLTLTTETESLFDGIVLVGLPLGVDAQLFNCAAVIHRGMLLGIVPKSFIPNYKEFYEGRWFSPAATAKSESVLIGEDEIPFGNDLLFRVIDVPNCTIGIEICEDLWVPIPPSSLQAVAGATVLVNLSASNAVIAKAEYRHELVKNQSARCMAAYLYSSCGVWESTTDVVFDGHCLIAENGTVLAESERLQREPSMLIVDIDLERLSGERMRTNSFGEGQLYLSAHREFQTLPIELGRPTCQPIGNLRRKVERHPFVPQESEERDNRCEDIFKAQVAGLARRIEHARQPKATIGISGGLDSTLALLVACKTVDALKLPRSHIHAFTMPGFGTTSGTLNNARNLMRQLEVTAHEVDIRSICLEKMRAMKHQPFGIDLTDLDVETLTTKLQEVPHENRNDLIFENVQARMRTSILMNNGFVIGTGDVSELALGWCTYNGDHMSMYNPNVSIPKTLVKFLVEWAARKEFEGDTRQTLLAIVETKISPELLPPGKEGEIVQDTEAVVGPYELHDFFLYHFLRFGTRPSKILLLAEAAGFTETYSMDTIRHWLTLFLRRFFQSQFKRSCLPDGPKVGSISLSPRGDWRMPSDATVREWLDEVNIDTA